MHIPANPLIALRCFAVLLYLVFYTQRSRQRVKGHNPQTFPVNAIKLFLLSQKKLSVSIAVPIPFTLASTEMRTESDAPNHRG
jgi:hypothetical protein